MRHCCQLTLAIVLVILTAGAFAQAPAVGDPGVITKSSTYSALETVERYEGGLRAEGFFVFTELDHSAAAARYGVELRPRIVVLFGRPKMGTANLKQAPTLAIDAPFKALIWQDDDGKVWLTYNSSEYVAEHIFPRHGITLPEDGRKNLGQALEVVCSKQPPGSLRSASVPCTAWLAKPGVSASVTRVPFGIASAGMEIV